MKFDRPLIPAVLIKRYKRFLADIAMADGSEMTVHCANPGSMLGLAAPGNRVWLSDSQNPKRKLRMTLEMIEVDKALVGVNTHMANKLAEEAIAGGHIAGLCGYTEIRREVKYGQNSRIDFLLTGEKRRHCFVEVKSVTLSRKSGVAEFPDSVTKRGTKHLGELCDQIKTGARAVQLFVVQRTDCRTFTPAQDIDPAYSQALRAASRSGVEIMAVKCDITADEIKAGDMMPINLT